MAAYHEELAKAGALLDASGLQPSSKGWRIKYSGGTRTIVDGPFAETKELIAGYTLIKVKTRDEAVDWARRFPNPHLEDGEIEIRQLYELEDFAQVEAIDRFRELDAGRRAVALGLQLPRFEDGKALRIAGLNQAYTMENRTQIPLQWQRFVPHIGKIAGQVQGYAYGVCWNDKMGFNFDYLTGVEVPVVGELPEGFTTLDLKPQRYAVFAHQGHISNLVNTIETIWMKWVPDSGLKAARAPCFERYTPEFDPHQGIGGIELWIPVEA
jgi:predicted transcriptional regulator YdeE